MAAKNGKLGSPSDDSNQFIEGGNGNDKVHGGKGDDTINGGAGNDHIKGHSGDDLITGGAGADKLTGNGGNDHFIYQDSSDSPAASGWDRITDFTQGNDKIDLAALLGPADLSWGNTTATANGAWYQNSGSSTFVYADTNGDSNPDLKIELENTTGLVLTVNDFIGVSEAPQVNTPPVAFADNVITSAEPGDEFFIPEWALLWNDFDLDGDLLNIESVDTTSEVDIVSLMPGTVSFLDDESDNDFAAPSFTYVATDGQAQSVEPATVNITQDFLDGAIDGTDGNDILVGKPNQGDIFFGNGGSDILIGENLSDTMSGGTGNDTLSGGEGNDGFTYSFTSPIVTSTDGLDTILDFTWGEDKLNFSGVTQAEFEANFDVDDSQDVTGDSQADTVMTINGSAGWSLTLAGVSGHDLTDFSNNAIMFS